MHEDSKHIRITMNFKSFSLLLKFIIFVRLILLKTQRFNFTYWALVCETKPSKIDFASFIFMKMIMALDEPR